MFTPSADATGGLADARSWRGSNLLVGGKAGAGVPRNACTFSEASPASRTASGTTSTVSAAFSPVVTPAPYPARWAAVEREDASLARRVRAVWTPHGIGGVKVTPR
jgi:hypothetical protein